MRKKAVLITGIAAAAVILGGATVAVAASTQTTDDQPLNGSELQQASDAFQMSTVESQGRDDDSNLTALSAEDRDKAGNAALARVGQGTVSEVERENEGGSAYEVEVRLNDGTQVEVQLGADFQVLRQDAPERDDD